jgi:hypothetical protein
MKRQLVSVVMVLGLIVVPIAKVHAQDPITEAIKEAITKVVKAVDLQVQRWQNETIWLQNAQKVLENTMSELKLTEISDWAEKQRTLYADYFDELWKVKNAIAYYHRIKDITEKEAQLVKEYKKAYARFKSDKHFTVQEIVYMGELYAGIMDESAKNLDNIMVVINSFSTQMSDAKRLEIINTVAENIEENYRDLQAFNRSNALISLQRSADYKDAEVIKKLYGLQ